MSDLPPIEIYTVADTPQEVELAVVKVVNADGFLVSTNNLSDVEDPEQARQNLGIVGGVKPDWDAEQGSSAEILNKPNLGTAAAANVESFATAAQGELAESALQPASLSDYVTESELTTALSGKQDSGDYLTPSSLSSYETTTQLNARDTANRNRSNHTGTQAISTISGLETALSGKEAADANILKSASIGVTVQPYNADTVIDPDYNTFTDAEKTKLAGIGAQKETIILALTAPGVNIALGEILAINAFPYAMTITSVRADVGTAPTGANLIVDMRKNNVSMMTNKFVIEATETSSTTATVLPSLSSSSLAIGNKLSFNVDQIGATVAGQYLTVTIEGERV